MNRLIEELFSIVFAFIVCYGVIPYGLCMVLKQKHLQKEESTRQKNLLKNRNFSDKYK